MPASFADMPAAERRRRRFLNVALTTHEGKTVRFYDDLIKDKTVLLNFFYTNCVNEAVCPLTTANLVRVQKLLAPRVGRDVFIYSISLDPEHDTPNVLAKYARAFEIKPGWLFLTGKPEDKDRSQHIGMLRMGIEPLERWAACASLVRPEWIVQSLVRLEPRQAAQQERHGGKSRL